MKDKKEISVFIASPGDVTAERTVVREICEDLNKSALLKPYGISFQAIGWEDAFPSPGRPQELINRLVEECDIFVCIFHKRFGSPTGKEASGTLEEFLLAYDSWKSLKKPHIMTYFKEVQIRSRKEQEDPQLTKVLDLKDKIEEEKLLLFEEFSTTDDFCVKIKDHLEKWTAESAKGWEKINGKISKLIPETELPLIIPPTYKNWISMRCEKMDIDKLVDTKDKGLISLTLPETFIPLYAAPPDKKTKAEMFIPFYTEQIGKKTKQEQKEIEKGQSAVDIETLIAEHEYLLISGQAGSGKTTLLKYLAYTIEPAHKLKNKP